MEIVTVIALALLAISEVVAFIPEVKENSVFQLIVSVLRSFVGKKKEE